MGFNAADYLLTRNVESGRGAKTAVRGSEELSYAELDERVGEVAAAYRVLGLRRDDRVLMVMSDDIPMLTAILGAFRAGVVAVPVSTMLTGGELGAILADSGARVIISTPEFDDAVATAIAAAPEVEVAIRVGGPADQTTTARALGWDEFLAGGAGGDTATAATSDDSWALWLYTSGTTGTPKAAMHRHANIRHVCETYGSRVLGITESDVCLSVAKMFFAYGIGNSVFFPFSVGATTVLVPQRPTPDGIAAAVREHQPTLFYGVPTFFAALLGAGLPEDTFASVRMGTSAGEPLPAPLQQRFKDRFGVDILDGIGSTEALHIFLSNQPGDIQPGTTGVAVPGYAVEIRDESGSPVPQGTPGALFVRGESIALGYWRRTDASRQMFQGEWLSTGDTYIETDGGYYQCLGRNSDMIKAGGIWVSPAEVESRLLAHPSVEQAAVVGVEDAEGLVKPVAAVTASGVTETELIDWCRDGMAHFKAPRAIHFVDDLPKTATGKLQRFKVRERFAAGPAPLPAEPPAEVSESA